MFQQFSSVPKEKKEQNPTLFQRYSNLKTPVRYDDLHKEIKNVFLSENDKLEGLGFTFVNPVTQSGFHACSTIHSFQLHSDGMQPAEYSVSVQYRTKNSTGFCRIDTHSWIVQGVLQQKLLNEKLKLDLNYNVFLFLF
jgi:gentisate 1,2-dioxygenase